MKKRYLFVSGAKRWNNLLAKFSKLQKRVELLSSNDNNSLYKRLVNKMESIFSKLEKMQYQTGIKLAGTTLAIVLSAFTANAQFAAAQNQTYNGPIYKSGNSTFAFADIDNDGDEDLYLGLSNGKIEFYTNNNGQYSYTSLVTTNGGVPFTIGTNASPEFADLDNDGDLDLYVGTGYGYIRTYINTNGVFSNGANLQADGADIDIGTKSTPTFVDIDGDGDLDLYVGGASGEIREFLNNNGVFNAIGPLAVTGSNSIASILLSNSKPIFADIDSDGDLDLYAGGSNGTVEIFTNNNGAFTPASNVQANGISVDIGSNSAPSFNDADGDGDLDLYVSGMNSKINIYNNNAGVFTAAGTVSADGISVNMGGRSTPTFADLDNDGDFDLHIGDVYGSIHSFTNTNGVFTDINKLDSISVINYACPTFADLDNDGDLDLYVGNYNRIYEYTNNNSVFANPSTLQANGSAISTYYLAPAFADIDTDGDLDLFVGEYGQVIRYENTNGVYAAGIPVQENGVDIDVSYGAKPTFADIDNDGDLDLFVGNHDGKVKQFINNNGAFAAGTNVVYNSISTIDVGFYSAPALADIDGDGDFDLYVGDSEGRIAFYENITPITVGLKETQIKQLNIYPNPVKNQLFVDINEQEVTSIEIIDYSGKIVKKEANNNAKSIDVANLTQGIYILKITTKKGVLTNRFIKQ